MFPVAMKMSVGVDVLGVLSDEFENVDFAAAGPADGAYVISKSPDGGPDTEALGDLGADFDFAELPTGESFGVETGRGVIDPWEFFGWLVFEGIEGW